MDGSCIAPRWEEEGLLREDTPGSGPEARDGAEALADGLPLAGERQTTRAFLEGWLGDTAAPRVRPKTLRGYEEMVRLHIAPEVGRILIARLTPQHVEKMLSGVAAKGVSPRTVGHSRAVLRNALSHAMRHGLVARNVAALADAPPVPAREFQALTPLAARRVLEAITGDRLEALFTVALALGLRQSETLGLRWSDVNVDASTLNIQRTLQRVNGAFTFFPPKNAAVSPDHRYACSCGDSPTPAHEAPTRGTDSYRGSMER